MQEEQYAGLIHFCLAERLFASYRPSLEEIRRIGGALRNLEKIAANPMLDIDGAFTIALEMENSEVHAAYYRLTRPLDASMYLVRRKIAASFPDSISRLAAAGRKFGVDRKILQKLDRLQQQSRHSGAEELRHMSA